MMNESQSAQRQGWYPDPSDDALLRWWDGDRWTDSTRHHPDSAGSRSMPNRAAGRSGPTHFDRSEEWGGPVSPPQSEAGGARESRYVSQGSGSPSFTSAPSSQVDEPTYSTGLVVIRGEARAVQQRSVGSQTPMEILTFRVERYDSAGNRLTPVPVELGGGLQWGGGRISGQVSDGDKVEVHGQWRGGNLRAEKIINRSTGAHVEGRSGWQELSEFITPDGRKKIRKGFLIALVVIVTVVVAAIATFVLVIHQANVSFNKQRDDSHRNWCLDIRDSGMQLPHECDGVI